MLRREYNQLKAEHEKLKKDYSDVRFENEGRKVAWEIHEVDKLLAEKKSIKGRREKEKAVSFFRSEGRSARQTAWILEVQVSTLTLWDKRFDENMKPMA